MRAGDQNRSKTLWLPVQVALFGLILLSGIAQVRQLVEKAGPKLGDFIVFSPDQKDGSSGLTSLTVRRTDGGTCVLDVATLRRGWGSLVIEARYATPKRVFQAHLSGQGTGAGPDDCGRSADLLLRPDELTALAVAAGGYGVSRRRSAEGPLWPGREFAVP